MAEKMLWNKEHTQSVKASKLRSLGVYGASRDFPELRPKWKILGWFNRMEDFHFGYFDTVEEANKFLEDLNIQIES